MKKTLLSIMAFALSLTAVNAQTKALAENQEYMPAHGVVTVTTGDATKIQGYDEIYDFYRSDMAEMILGAKLDLDAVFARFHKEDLEKYIGYKVVGISVAGEFGQNNVDIMLNISCNQTWGENVRMSSKNVAIAKGAEVKPSVHGMKIYNWNDVMFETPYVIPAKKENAAQGDPEDFQDLYAGYWVKNAAGKIVVANLLVGQYYSDVVEEDTHTDPGTYIQQTGSSTKVPTIAGMFPQLLPIKLILEKPAGLGVNSASNSTNVTETGRYTVDGTRIYLPTRGINIVKMSDGTTRKVVVNK